MEKIGEGGYGRRKKGDHEDIGKPLGHGRSDVKGNNFVKISRYCRQGGLALGVEEVDIGKGSHHEGDTRHGQDKESSHKAGLVERLAAFYGHEFHGQLGLGKGSDSYPQDQCRDKHPPEIGSKGGHVCPALVTHGLELFRHQIGQVRKGRVRFRHTAHFHVGEHQ